jgi:hypothetical protein
MMVVGVLLSALSSGARWRGSLALLPSLASQSFPPTSVSIALLLYSWNIYLEYSRWIARRDVKSLFQCTDNREGKHTVAMNVENKMIGWVCVLLGDDRNGPKRPLASDISHFSSPHTPHSHLCDAVTRNICTMLR